MSPLWICGPLSPWHSIASLARSTFIFHPREMLYVPINPDRPSCSPIIISTEYHSSFRVLYHPNECVLHLHIQWIRHVFKVEFKCTYWKVTQEKKRVLADLNYKSPFKIEADVLFPCTLGILYAEQAGQFASGTQWVYWWPIDLLDERRGGRSLKQIPDYTVKYSMRSFVRQFFIYKWKPGNICQLEDNSITFGSGKI